MEYLKSNLVRQNAIGEDENLDISTLREMLRARFESIDYRSAMDDISRFVLDDRIKDDWASKVFIEASEKLRSE